MNIDSRRRRLLANLMSIQLVVIFCSCSKSEQPAITICGSWDSLSTESMITHGGHAAAAVREKIYVFGGFSAETPNEDSTKFFSPIIQVFDPKTNGWSSLKTAGTFTPRISLSADAIGDSIYLIGGFTDTGVSNAIEVFNTRQNAWSTPTTTGAFIARGNHASCVVRGKIYVMGGLDFAGKFIDWVDVFDPVGRTWSRLNTQGTYESGEYCDAVPVGDSIFLLGGHQRKINLRRVEILDLRTNSWSKADVKGRLRNRACFNANLIHGKIYAIGGSTGDTFPEVVDVFDPTTDTWMNPAYKGTFTGRLGLTCTTIGNRIYAIGGGANGTLVRANQVFTPSE